MNNAVSFYHKKIGKEQLLASFPIFYKDTIAQSCLFNNAVKTNLLPYSGG